MQLILLSGGSGKRLWPLSNNARSKQFLPLLEKTEGTSDDATATKGQNGTQNGTQGSTMESMVQRVVRQIRDAHLTDDITLATNASQLDIITNQLGDTVSVVTEPERRDTFPAIALAASYLSLSKGCKDDEVVIIMPCDPYTEAGYFETIRKMAQCVEADVADLVLMGIKPTYPSAKYGYVVPEANDNDGSTSSPQVNDDDGSLRPFDQLRAGEAQGKLSSPQVNENFQRVSRFTEKPDVPTAEQLLKQGAYWNGGVFAFRLGYMMNIVGRYLPIANANAKSCADASDSRFAQDRAQGALIRDFETLRSRYSEFPKISFDYEVAEKAKSVAVVPFEGEWKDLGTWNTLTDELRQHAIGNAHLGPKNVNTHVINELSTPIFVDGLKDAVVAASPDGILVCAKSETENIKKYVDGLTPRPMYEERRWGTYRVIDSTTYTDGCKSLTKSITLRSGKNISYQIHAHRDEVWTFVDGEGLLLLDDRLIPVSRGYVANIKRGQKHAVKALTDLTFIEVQSGEELIEEDITRLQLEWPEASQNK